MRQHYYGRVRNTYGTVQAGVDVSIYLAGTVNAAIVYTVASGGIAITVAPQIQSDSDGLIDFYIDESYGSSQLFDLKTGDKTYENISITFGLGDDDLTQYVLASGARAMNELTLTPKASSTGPEGTIFYCSTDKQVYVGVEI